VGQALPAATARWPHRVALVLGPDRLTFTELSARVEALSARLRSAGVGRDDHVLVQLPNTVELVVTVLAAWHVGAVPVPVLAMYRERELRHVLAATRPVAVVAGGSSADRRPSAEIAGLLDELGQVPALRALVGDGPIPPGWEPFPAPGEPVVTEPTATRPDDCALVLFTSGTTSQPKGVRHSSRSLFAEARTYRDGARFSASDALLLPSPVPHIGALVAAALLPSVTGGRTVVMPRWDADAAVELGAAEGVTLAVGAPVFLAELLDRYERGGGGSHRIPRFHTGAAPTGSTIIRRADAMGVVAWRAWGMTECPTVSYGGADDPLELRESRDGRIEAGSEVRAFDESGRALPEGMGGELRLRSPKLMLGYLADGMGPGEDTATGLDEEGWFATGDIGVVHPDGWVSIRGRLKDVINRGGEKFAAGEIESAICSHPDIDSAAVVGVPDQRLGERVAAFVTVRAGRGWPGPDVLVAHLDGQGLARRKLPVVWRVLAELPRTPTGKIRKNELLAGWDG
jgi:acyl-CoA synthetase (AMP-forming)/AMP-acid ligase II